jgi:NAD+ diphosphatase
MLRVERYNTWLVFSNNQLMLIKKDGSYRLPDFFDLPSWIYKGEKNYALGSINNANCFCIELNAQIELSEPYEWVSLKSALDLLDIKWFTVAAKASQVLLWEKNHQYCGRCSEPTIHKLDTFERSCKHCKLYFYPRISPSIIVMIKKEDKILMARKAQFPPGTYALVAGFVEPGESLEQALHREVKEEVGISVKNIRYFGSQSWPFPDSLMLAFTADHDKGEIVMEDGEFEAADWFSAENLPGFPASKVSIARKLTDSFLTEQALLKAK